MAETKREAMTHEEIVKVAHKWLQSKCGCVVSELATMSGEQPDVFGFRSDSTWLIECKVSRSDFLSDRNKMFRKHPYLGMGDFRFYCAPKGMIKKEELPTLWGLIEVDENGKARCTHNPHGEGNIYSTHKKHEKHSFNEYLFMYSILRRCELRGYMSTIKSDLNEQLKNSPIPSLQTPTHEH